MAVAWDESKAMEMGRRIKSARQARGMSLQQVANRLEISKGTVGHWETGVRTIKVEDLYALCELLLASADQILFGRRQWPFVGIDLEAVQALESDEIRQIEGAIKLVAAQVGLDLKPATTPATSLQLIELRRESVYGPSAEEQGLLDDLPTPSPALPRGKPVATGRPKRRALQP